MNPSAVSRAVRLTLPTPGRATKATRTPAITLAAISLSSVGTDAFREMEEDSTEPKVPVPNGIAVR
ncbi:hypothetical protein GCM10009550_08440 [Actinocorallia libanotica]|uniref:Uncharacterized protein n=1 Tax=Actinocorallia libanotica TaxID=46162 RepID=A0ABN1QA24_9ACTN